MPKQSSRFFVMLGYELRTFEEALGLRITYGEARKDPLPKDRNTPTLVMMPDEARALARDLLELADKLEGAPAPATPLH